MPHSVIKLNDAWPLIRDGLFTVTLVDITCTSMKGTARPITLSPQKRRGIQPNVHVVAIIQSYIV